MTSCPHCREALDAEVLAFCPFCGGKLDGGSGPQATREPATLLAAAVIEDVSFDLGHPAPLPEALANGEDAPLAGRGLTAWGLRLLLLATLVGFLWGLRLFTNPLQPGMVLLLGLALRQEKRLFATSARKALSRSGTLTLVVTVLALALSLRHLRQGFFSAGPWLLGTGLLVEGQRRRLRSWADGPGKDLALPTAPGEPRAVAAMGAGLSLLSMVLAWDHVADRELMAWMFPFAAEVTAALALVIASGLVAAEAPQKRTRSALLLGCLAPCALFGLLHFDLAVGPLAFLLGVGVAVAALLKGLAARP